ncbi:DNA mismatch repair protein MutL [Lentinus tigrinus ALCF2SS1-7]|uniref:DNA mismatch repair protein PMS1 n=1 Tax=Lentinus tigrinus ALCF2SS1-6 TaxID=1328759 RepID=A0A5C2RNS1_9APHY|nr:DNA mismatch repair protein MutL [Lentinus tigrinus ALCF2SS1-6]RPD72680.1 DNA mismatch repair protein MutL [Lentinus tigrinus ALCF2SS1-7]
MNTDQAVAVSSSKGDATGIKALDAGSVHKISSGQVVVDLQTAVKELVENSLDAGATNIEVRFKEYGLESFEVVDNGSGIPPEDYDSIALKHHTSKLSSFTDLESVATFGFRGEALSSLCALAESVSVTTATAAEAPAGSVIEFERTGKAKSKKGKAARQRGTTVTVSGLFKPLPVRRKELERNAKREFGKALTLLHAYALVPCAKENKGVRLSVTNQTSGGKKTVQLRTDGTPSTRASVSAIWGPKVLENLVELDLTFVVEVEAAVLRRLGKTQDDNESSNEVKVRGLISKFAVGCGRNGTDRQFCFVNGRPCSPSKVQKAFNEVYRSFNATQSPFIIADFILPTSSCDINVSPDKRTILLHSENNLVQALRTALEEKYAPSRATYDINASQAPRRMDSAGSTAATQPRDTPPQARAHKDPLFLPEELGDDASPVTSQPSSEPLFAEAAGPSVVESDEPTFGEPTFLSEPSSSSAPLASQEHGVDLEAEVRELSTDRAEEVRGVGPFEADVDVDMDVDVDADASAKARPNANGYLVGARLPTRAPSRARQALDEDGDRVASPEGEAPMSQTVTQMSRRLAERASPAAMDDSPEDAPIPSLRPPVRPVVRASSQSSKSPAEQMVLSTSGASWNLRRPADDVPGERPKKKSKLEAPRDGRGAREGMRELLRGFARTGSQVVEVKMDVDEEGEEGEEGEDVAAEEEDEQELVSSRDDGEDRPETQETGSSGVGVGDDGPMEEDESPTGQVIDITHGEDRDVPEPVTARSDLGDSSASATNEEIVRTTDHESVSMTFDLSSVVSSWDKLRTRLTDAVRERERERIAKLETDKLDSAGIGSATDDDEAVETLSRVIDKDDFAHMEIVGQFNLGFIIVRRRKSRSHKGDSPDTEMDDLFIVDQHAADEKYNFETLQRTTKIDSQMLFRPHVLELAAADEIVALENIDVLRQNGFELDVSEDRAPGQRMQLTAQPISKSTVFDMKDLEELLHLMQDRPAGQMVRCSKARAMFAMRACRKSIMIGTPLNRRQMTSIVQHMGTINQPWHCPHGRPTMRHLSDIGGVGWDPQRDSVKHVEWAAFGRAASEG